MRTRPFACLIAMAWAATPAAQGQYPARPVRIVVPTSPGAAADTVARLISQPLSERLGQPVVVENRAGAANMIGIESVAKSAPDGHVLLMTTPALVVNPSLYKKVSYDALRDFAAITQPYSQPNVLVVHPSLPAKSVKELIALAAARPGEMTFASAGTGSMPHLAMELLLLMSGTRMLHVPYRGAGPGIIDLVAGRISVMNLGIVAAGSHIRSARLRALGVTGGRRATTMPSVPTIAEAGVAGYEMMNWNGLLAPAGTSREVISRLHREVTVILRTAEVSERIAKEGAEVIAGSPQDLATHMGTEMAKWAKVVKAAGIQAE